MLKAAMKNSVIVIFTVIPGTQRKGLLIFSIAEPYQDAGVFGGDELMHVTH
jgi:hypothetical protein